MDRSFIFRAACRFFVDLLKHSVLCGGRFSRGLLRRLNWVFCKFTFSFVGVVFYVDYEVKHGQVRKEGLFEPGVGRVNISKTTYIILRFIELHDLKELYSKLSVQSTRASRDLI